MSAGHWPESALRVWSITTGEVGSRHQAAGLAAELCPDAEEKTVAVNRLWALVPPSIFSLSLAGITGLEGRLAPPWPDVLISCGRRAGLAALAIRRRNRAAMICVHIQKPPAPGAFDLVVAMPHDRAQGAEVLSIDTAMHGVRPETLAQVAAGGDPRFVGLPRPWRGVLVGGSTRRNRFTGADAERLIAQLDAWQTQSRGSLLITPSRRSSSEAIAVLQARYAGSPCAFLWDGAAPNPYLPILALADELVVTSDSISMISEALATQAPVWIFGLTSGRRHGRFVDHLLDKSLVARLGAAPPAHRPAGIDATLTAAEAVRGLLTRRLGHLAP